MLQFNQFFCNCQSQTGSSETLGYSGVSLNEILKNAFLVCRANADSGIGDLKKQLYFITRLARRSNFNFNPSIGSKFNGVVHQIIKYLYQSELVAR